MGAGNRRAHGFLCATEAERGMNPKHANKYQVEASYKPKYAAVLATVYSTVTLLARLRGWSTLHLRMSAM